MLKVQEVTKNYGPIRALDNISLAVREGEALGLVGPNGSGKTTMLKIMLGILRPTSGTVAFRDSGLSEKSWKEFKRLVGYMPERVSFYDNLTGKETLKLFARVKGADPKPTSELIARILSEDLLLRKVGTYSKGMRQRLNLAQALVSEPEILVLDEPTSGLDPVAIREFYDILDEVRSARNLTVILSSHILAEIEDKTDRVAIMKNGTIKAIGRLEELYTGMNIPLGITIRTDKPDNVLEGVLRDAGATELTYRNGYLLANVPGDKKLNILSALMEEKDRFTDISIREPSLEEVFFGVH
jgi:Cu-processing system ATP-binding protein